MEDNIGPRVFVEVEPKGVGGGPWWLSRVPCVGEFVGSGKDQLCVVEKVIHIVGKQEVATAVVHVRTCGSTSTAQS